MRESTFRPYILVNDDGEVHVELSDCYMHTLDSDTDTESYDDEAHAAVLDHILGVDGDDTPSIPEQLRRLADFIENGGRS